MSKHFIFTKNPLTPLLFVSPLWLHSKSSHLHQRANSPREALTQVQMLIGIYLSACMLIISLRIWKGSYRLLGSFNGEEVSEQIVLLNWPNFIFYNEEQTWKSFFVCLLGFISPPFLLFNALLSQPKVCQHLSWVWWVSFLFRSSRYIALLAKCHLGLFLICIG